jgi:hypothetical protein
LGEYLATFADDPAGEVSGNKYFGRVLASFPIHPQQYQQDLKAQGHKWYGSPPKKNLLLCIFPLHFFLMIRILRVSTHLK